MTNSRGMSKEAAAAYAGCDSLSSFSDWIRRGIMPGPIPGTHKWDRKALNIVCRKPLDPDLFGITNASDWMGQVYFVTDGYDTKIGYSRKWRLRLSNLRTASPRELRPLALFYAHPGQERALHTFFDEIRVRGEWFAHGPAIMKSVKLIKSMGIDCL